MRYHAIFMNFVNRPLVLRIAGPDFPYEDYIHMWYLIPEDGSRPFVANDLTLRQRYTGVDRKKLMQVVMDK